MSDHIIFLHGLGRTSRSLRWLAAECAARGYGTTLLDYPSQRVSLAEAEAQYFRPAWETLQPTVAGEARIHVVTHSLGGLVVREWLATQAREGAVPLALGRLVMLSPPSQGAEVIDAIGATAWGRWILGPIVDDLGTGPSHAAARLGALPTGVEAGVIMGTQPFIPFFQALLESPNDGIVSARRGHIVGETDFTLVPADHTFIMRRRVVRDLTLAFLETGKFPNHRSRRS
jgi:triacylglycerol lipase